MNFDHIAANEINRLSPMSADVLYAERSGEGKANSSTLFYQRVARETGPCPTCDRANRCDSFPAIGLSVDMLQMVRGESRIITKDYALRSDRGMQYVHDEAHRIMGMYRDRGRKIVAFRLIPDSTGTRECGKFQDYIETKYGRYHV